MGLTDFSSKVITFFKADVSDMKSGLKELQGEEKKLAQAQLEAANERNKGLDQWTERLGHANQALELVGKAVSFGKEAFNAYADQLRLQAAAGAISIDRLKDASLGLRTEDELLAFAAKTQHGAFKLTQEQMELAQRAMVGLTRAGFDQADVTNKVTEALVTGKTRGLREFGIEVKATGDETESLNAIMGELATKATGVQNGSRTAGEEVKAMGVSMGDSIDNMKEAIGQLVTAMAPLLNALARAVSLIADVVSSATSALVGTGDGSSLSDMIEQIKKKSGADVIEKKLADQIAIRNALNSKVDLSTTHDADREDHWGGNSTPSLDEGSFYTWSNGILKKLPKSGGAPTRSVSDYIGSPTLEGQAGQPIGFGKSLYSTALEQAGYNPLNDLVAGDPIGDQLKKLREEQMKAEAAAAGHLAADQAQLHANQQSYLERTFGKLEDFNAYGKAFDMLTGSVTAGLDAWIDGSESAGTAIKKFIASALKGLASQMAIEALKHGAYALGSLAFGDVAGAGRHAAAAAAFGAGAAAAAVAAKEMGGGGSAPKGGSSSAGSGAGGSSSDHGDQRGGGGGGGPRGRDVFVIYTDAFADASPRVREQQARKVVGKVTGGQGWENS